MKSIGEYILEEETKVGIRVGIFEISNSLAEFEIIVYANNPPIVGKIGIYQNGFTNSLGHKLLLKMKQQDLEDLKEKLLISLKRRVSDFTEQSGEYRFKNETVDERNFPEDFFIDQNKTRDLNTLVDKIIEGIEVIS